MTFPDWFQLIPLRIPHRIIVNSSDSRASANTSQLVSIMQANAQKIDTLIANTMTED